MKCKKDIETKKRNWKEKSKKVKVRANTNGIAEQDRTLSEVLQKSEFWQVFMNDEGNVPLTTKGGATRPLESWKIETSFLLTNNDSQQLIIVDMIISNCPTKKVLAMQWDTHEASKCWCSSTSIEQSMSVLQKCLFCSVIARSQSCSWTPYGTQREVVQKFERVTFLVYGYPTNDKRTFHFQCLENDSCPWVVSLQELFLDWKYDILKEAQKSSKKCYFTT